MVVVWWLKLVVCLEEFWEFGEEEIVSVYEFIGYLDYVYCLGDVVICFVFVLSGVFELELYEFDVLSVEGMYLIFCIFWYLEVDLL